MIDNRDITVVVQGPVVASRDRAMDEGITEKCIASIRRVLPGAHLIISTWRGQPVEGLDADELVLSDDPGTVITEYSRDGEPDKSNNNRQIVSSLNGLRKVKTRYAMKLRSDNYLVSDAFVDLQQRFPKRSENARFLKERVVVNNTFTRRYSKGRRVNFHLCDFFYFGLTEDLLALWNLPLFEDLVLPEEKKGSHYYLGAPHTKVDCTQKFLVRALQAFDPDIKQPYLHYGTERQLRLSDEIYANNFVIAEPEIIGLGLCSKFSGGERANRLSGRLTYINFDDWQLLYQRHCDSNYDARSASRRLIKRNFLRFFLLLAKSVEEFARSFKKQIKSRA